MRSVIDAAWRAAAYCVHPLVIGLSVLPLVLTCGVAYLLARAYWEPAIDGVRAAFESWALLAVLFKWLEAIGLLGLKSVLAPLVVVFLATPVIVFFSLLAVAVLMAPFMLKLVARRRFPALELRRGGSFMGSLFVSVSATFIAAVAMVVSIPFWLVPPVALVVPPLIWGWLTYRVMSYDMLVDHASQDERRTVVQKHRVVLLVMGVLSGYLGAAPSLLWVSGVMFVAFAPVLVPIAIWVYTLVFAFSALWFAHYLLAALQAHRLAEGSLKAEAAVIEALPKPVDESPGVVR
ncbi:EI24 domain-containing protein [Piscinibacter gummiphilus]|uniref:EI24 domain-containing protein n=1 Tax=Piscinibacter gummiphilus TaxID=946333 RepID=A0ABZ0CW47_9BURK|nr:EI24 domain-containing protein [Piscinibacter gummiphilus]WOB06734.1 EI24 domain-containing protein [Piscinibacter gummiphilus]